MIKTVVCMKDSEQRCVLADLWYYSLAELEDVRFLYASDLEELAALFRRTTQTPELVILDRTLLADPDMDLFSHLREISVFTEVILYDHDETGSLSEKVTSSGTFFATLHEPLSAREVVSVATEFLQTRNMDLINSITVRTGGRTRTLPCRKIRYFESNARKITAFFDKEEVVFYMKMSELEELLPNPDFLRCHQRYLLNKKNILSFGNQEILLDNGLHIPVSKRYHQEVKRRLRSL